MSDPIALVCSIDADQERRYLAALHAAMPDETIRPFCTLTAGQRERVRVAIVANPEPAKLAALPRLEWMHSLWAGVERLVGELPADAPRVVRLVDPEMSRTMAEAVIAWTYYLHRDMPAYLRQQRDATWQQRSYRKPATLTVGVLGLGALGATAAAKLHEAGFRVTGWSRTRKALPQIDTCSGDEGLTALLATSDIVVSLIPLTEATRGLLDADRISAMKPGAALVNFSRGPVVVTRALLAALDSGRLSHAVLDVFDEEPLPAASPLWHHPHVTVLPHISAPTDFDTAAAIVADNVARFRATGAIPSTVDPARGY